MRWITGILTPVDEEDHRSRYWVVEPKEDGAMRELTSGHPLELRIGGRWLRGRVEFGDRIGYYWTDNRNTVPLGGCGRGRVWGSEDWPPPERRQGPEYER